MNKDKTHHHFWRYISGSWSTTQEVIEKYQCVLCRELTDLLQNPNISYSILVEKNKFWWNVGECSKSLNNKHSWHPTGKDLKCVNCGLNISDYNNPPKDMMIK